MRNRKVLPLALIVLAAFYLITFSSCFRQRDTRKAGKTASELRYGFTSEPATLDPLSPANTADGRSILFNVFEGMVKPDTDGRMMPCAAASWTMEEGGLVYNFTLREGMRFHDGSILTSADVKFSLETAIAAGFDSLASIEKINAPDQNQISVILKMPDPEFLPYLSIGLVKAGNENREKNVIGTGPFFIESYTAQQNLVLKKFNGYWHKDLPRLDKVTIVFLADTEAALLALRGGGIDGVSVTGAQAAQLDRRRFDIFDSFSASVQLLALNNEQPPFDDIRVRKAINYCIDARGIIDAAFFGMGKPSPSPIIPGLSIFYENNLGGPVDLEKARALLAEAGYGGKGGKLALEISVPSNYTMHVDTAQVIVRQLSEIGIDATVRLVDWASWLSDVYRGRKYQATIISLDSSVVSPRGFLSRYRSTSGSNFINFKNDDFDSVYNTVLAETDEKKRIALYKEAQRIIMENAASVYIQDIFYFKVFKGGAYGGVLNYPLYVIDFASIYGAYGTENNS
ncbi:MAG: ABC transporter substrate-binding protein [Treponema sp.]|jgi:peptide/nickel transport system substrate-binding protein|nr:ABC transporter substrate-binding protein [Treponema sp.]